ncbi:MAG: rane-bound lytic murein transglycosylase [Bacteroidota bacterium]|jgi:membrane-bound lytic murein transglycosylase F|nr:YfhD protein [Methermicoccus sp.]MBZ4674698.1 YfhD protein [Dysgonamonadaceae bacterium]MDI3505448.1 rane-bound lytic murein transglycosylase [Bacteroidota bacterium]MDK2837066.1 rane-bound lytic murein transglycosylase [Bacteroidota bacterium]MDK2969536.1 rane-bound lytic murein transglycosylase [Bacteroidota bacterium]
MKSKKLLYLYGFLLIVVIWLMFSLRKQINSKSDTYEVRDYPQIKKSGELNVVTDYNAIGYFVSGDTLAGFQYELLRRLEKDWQIKVNIFLENKLEENLEGLLSRRYDIIARSIPVNIDLRSKVAFTQPILLNKQVLVQRKAEYNNGIAPIRQHLELAKKTIYVPANSPVILRLDNLSHEIGDTIFIIQDPSYETEQLIMKVAGGDIDFTVCDEKMATQMEKRLPEIDIETDIGFTQFDSWAVRKDSPMLLDSLNIWFSHFKKTKEFQLLIKKYLK